MDLCLVSTTAHSIVGHEKSCVQATQCSVLDPAQLSPSHPLSIVCVCRESEEIKQGIVNVPDCCSPVAVAEHRGWSPAAPFLTQLLPCMQPALETTRQHDHCCPPPTSTVLKRLFSLAPTTPSFAMDTTIMYCSVPFASSISIIARVQKFDFVKKHANSQCRCGEPKSYNNGESEVQAQ